MGPQQVLRRLVLQEWLVWVPLPAWDCLAQDVLSHRQPHFRVLLRLVSSRVALVAH